MRHTLIFCILFFFFSSFCVNTYHINESGQQFYESQHQRLPIFYQSFNVNYYQKLVDSIDQALPLITKESYKLLSDKSAALLKLGKTKEAKNILVNIYKKKPNEYNIIANLGTTYELLGNIDSSLFFIKKSLKINKDAHRGSEWFHVKILEAKKALEKDKDWLKDHKVLNLDFPELDENEITITDEINKTLQDIAYQLTERIPFSPEEDLLLANIFNEYGDLWSKVSVQGAYIIYGIGAEYDTKNIYGMKQKKQRMKRLIKKSSLITPSIKSFYPKRSKYSERPNELVLGPPISLQKDYSQAIYLGIGILILGFSLFIYGFRKLRKFILHRKKRNES